MKRTAWKCYWAFVPMAYKVGMIISALVLCGMGMLFFRTMGSGVIILLGPMSLALIGMIDYVAFSGVFSKKIRAMEYLKSSSYGPELVKKTLISDIIAKVTVYIMGCAGIGIAAVKGGMYWFNVVELFLLFLAPMFYTLVFTRKFGTSIQMQIMILYVGIHIASGLLVLYIFILYKVPDSGISAVVYKLVSMAVLLPLTVTGGHLLLKDSLVGFKNGYRDC